MSDITPFSANDFPADKQAAIDAIGAEFDKAEEEILKFSENLHKPLFAKRDAAVGEVPHFWAKAIANCPSIQAYIDDEDAKVFRHLTGVKVERPESDLRGATITLTFSDNEWFSDSALVKTFTPADDAPEALSEFDFVDHAKPAKTTISWKSVDKDLVKKNPLVTSGDSFEPGSFFASFFDSVEPVASTLGDAIANLLYPNAIQHFTGEAAADLFDEDSFDDDEEDDEEEEDDEDDEGDEDPEKEIDLEEEEKRPRKKSKN